MRRCLLLVVVLVSLAAPPTAGAAVYTVNSLNDDHAFGNAGDGACDTGATTGGQPECTLRAAIEEANGTAGDDEITFAVEPATITLIHGQLEVIAGEKLTITGPGADVLGVAPGPVASRVLAIATGAELRLVGLTLSGGSEIGGDAVSPGDPGGDALGGGILNDGKLTLVSSVVSDNLAQGGAGATGAEAADGGLGGDATGGGIYSSGTLVIEDSVVRSNRAWGGTGGTGGDTPSADIGGFGGLGGEGAGGGIVSVGALTVIDSSIGANEARGGPGGTGGSGGFAGYGGDGGDADGGGLAVAGPTIVDRSSIVANYAIGAAGGDAGEGELGAPGFDEEGSGGGIAMRDGLEITNTTISLNSAGGAGGGSGGGIDNSGGSLEAGHMTLAGNTAPGFGAANLNLAQDGLATLRASIIANLDGNPGGLNCSDPVASEGFNLEDDDSCGLSGAAGDLLDTEPQLAPLGADGTHAPAASSPAVDAVTGACPSVDQRGLPRPHGPACDIGAVELVPPADGVPDGSGGGPDDPPPAGPIPTGPAPSPADATPTFTGSAKARLGKKGRVTLRMRIGCPAPGGACAVRVRGRARGKTIGRATYEIGSEGSAAVRMKLTKAGARLLRKRKRLQVKVTITVTRAARTTTKTVKVRLVRRRART